MASEKFDLVGSIMAYEEGELGAEGTLKLFAELVKSGQAWQLQGSYGRAAERLINKRYLTRKGVITKSGEALIKRLTPAKA